jgi:hypothetical protein
MARSKVTPWRASCSRNGVVGRAAPWRLVLSARSVSSTMKRTLGASGAAGAATASWRRSRIISRTGTARPSPTTAATIQPIDRRARAATSPAPGEIARLAWAATPRVRIAAAATWSRPVTIVSTRSASQASPRTTVRGVGRWPASRRARTSNPPTIVKATRLPSGAIQTACWLMPVTPAASLT